MGVVERGKLPRSVVSLLAWGRRSSLWVLPEVGGCCGSEVDAALRAPRFDASRLGVRMVTSPGAADVLLVAGPITPARAERLLRVHAAMPRPAYVVAVGACAIAGGPFVGAVPGTVALDAVLPVDVHVPGCPPRPEAVLQGLNELQALIRGEDPAVRWQSAMPEPVAGRASGRVPAVSRSAPTLHERHVGIEGLCEQRTWAQAAVLVARLDAVASLAREVAYARAVEQLAGVVPPPRGAALREVALTLEHLVGATQSFVELTSLHGGATLAAASRTARERALDSLEEWTGARVHHDLTVFGGVRADLPATWPTSVRRTLDELWRWAREVEARLMASRAWQHDARGLAVLTHPAALAAGLTGPALRASTDTRVPGDGAGAAPEPPTHPAGDVFARAWVRLQALRWHCRRLLALLDALPPGPVKADDASRERFPERLPAGVGEAWVEHAGGLLGVLVVSAGGERPWRLRVASPAVAASVATARAAAAAPAGLGPLAALSFWASPGEAAR